jgi:single-stranded-DNA-specific exonuclease
VKIHESSDKLMIGNKKWIYKNYDDTLVERLCSEYGLSHLTASVLQNRTDVVGGFTIKPTFKEKFYDPLLLKDMDKAVERILDALDKNEKITIYGDYDADGVTSTSVLYLYLKERGACVSYYIPDRIDEGYGMNLAALDKIKAGGTELIITVDTGIAAADEIEYAKRLGIDVVVTDHHECKSSIPDCVAVIDPKRPDCPYPYKELAGVGVVFKLVTALEGGLSEELAKACLPLVSFGTVADVVPLTDENRRLVSLGLKYMSLCENKSIKALMKASGLAEKTITAGKIGFVVAPRINAAGRLGNANKSLELFLCDDYEKALQIANELTEENKRRQSIESEIFKEAVEIIEKNNLHENKVMVVASKGWHQGVVGIVSSKITEKYYKPSILISIDGEEGKGSGRSISSFNLFEALSHCEDLLSNFGGHELAAGLSISAGNIAEFADKINNYANNILSPEDFIPSLVIDANLKNSDLTIDSVGSLKKLEPYGMGNPIPVFSYNKARIKSLVTMSEGKHIKLSLLRDGCELEAVGFNMGKLAQTLKIGDIVDVAGTLDINEFRGEQKIQMFIKDLKVL